MARTALDDASHWHGSVTTGACFLDGSYDQNQNATAELLRTGAAGGKPSPAASSAPICTTGSRSFQSEVKVRRFGLDERGSARSSSPAIDDART